MSDDVVYRDARGVEYVSVPLPTHEVTEAVSLEARHTGRRASRVERPFYDGTNGPELSDQPVHHRKRWTDAQWAAFEEHRRTDRERAEEDTPAASAIVVKSTLTPKST